MYSVPWLQLFKERPTLLREKGVHVFCKTVLYWSQKTPLLHFQIVSLFELSLLGTKILPTVHLNWSRYVPFYCSYNLINWSIYNTNITFYLLHVFFYSEYISNKLLNKTLLVKLRYYVNLRFLLILLVPFEYKPDQGITLSEEVVRECCINKKAVLKKL